MTTELLIQLDVGIGPFNLGQSFREVVNINREFRAIEQPSSIEYSDFQPFHQHLILRSCLSILDSPYELLLAFEPYLQNLHLVKLSLQDKQPRLEVQYNRDSGAVKIGLGGEEGFVSLANIFEFLRVFKKKRMKVQEKTENQLKILKTTDELDNQTMFIFQRDTIEDESEDFHSLSSSQTTNTTSISSETPRVDAPEYKLKSIVILSDTYTTQIQSIPTRNLTPLSPVFTYNSTYDYIHIAIKNKTILLNCTDSAQEILTKLGTPTTKYYTKSLRKAPTYFYNYKTLGVDLMFNCNTHKVSMIVLHNNLPGHAHFNEYSRAFFTITHLLSEDEILDISYHTHWQSLSIETPALSELPSVTVSRHGNANSQYPFPPTTLVYLSKCCLLEVHDNGYISNVFIATNFSHPKLIDKYTHKRLNLLKQTEVSPENSSVSPKKETPTVNPFVDETPKLFDTEFSAKSNAVKYPYRKLPDLEDDYALYSYNPYLEPQPIPFKLQKTEQTNRTNYILKRIEVSGKTAQVKNRVKFDDIAYIPPCMQKLNTNKIAGRDGLSRGDTTVNTSIITNGNRDIASDNDVIFDSDINSLHEDTDNHTAFQTNGFVSRHSPTFSEVTEATPLTTVTTDSRMFSLRSSLFQSTHEEFHNGEDANLDPQLSIQSNVSCKSTKFNLSSQPPDFQALIEGATQEEIDFLKLTKEHNRIFPLLIQRRDIYSKILPLWYSGKNQQAIEIISLQEKPLSRSDPIFYSHVIKLFLTKEYNWTIKTSQTLLESLLAWICIGCPGYQLETTCLVIRLIIKRFRVRLIGSEPTNRALKEQFSIFTNTIFIAFTRLETIISHLESKSIPENIFKMVTECHHDLRLFKSKFPVS